MLEFISISPVISEQLFHFIGNQQTQALDAGCLLSFFWRVWIAFWCNGSGWEAQAENSLLFFPSRREWKNKGLLLSTWLLSTQWQESGITLGIPHPESERGARAIFPHLLAQGSPPGVPGGSPPLILSEAPREGEEDDLWDSSLNFVCVTLGHGFLRQGWGWWYLGLELSREMNHWSSMERLEHLAQYLAHGRCSINVE